LRAVRLIFLRSVLSLIALVFAIRILIFRRVPALEPLQLREFLHQLFHSEL
jgi:hypothetical protein